MRQAAAFPVPVVWTSSPPFLAVLAVCAIALGFVFYRSLAGMYDIWMTREEYSFGILVPFISAFLVWQRRDRVAALPFEGSWAGVGVVIAGLALGGIAHVATAQTVSLYAFLLALGGVVLAFAGFRGLRVLAAPLAMLLFMLPLPDVLMRETSAALQLYSSQLGVSLIRAAGVSVFLQGNVIDLGVMKLQVVEACSGLRYLLPLLTLGCIMAYFFRAPLWQRALLVASTIPVTLLMNSARIALIGVTADRFGTAAAEGFLHDFEGWAVFMACMSVLLVEIWLLSRLQRRPFRDVFGIELPGPLPAGAERRVRVVPAPLVAVAALLAGVAVAWAFVPQPESVVPARRDFSVFPLELGDWRGRPDRLNPEHLQILKLDDYLHVNYFDAVRQGVNVYIGYYATQRHGLAAHSPTECLPGDGWEMRNMKRHAVEGVNVGGQPLQVVRAEIQKGEARQLVYYWFQQRERTLASEFDVKLYLFWDLVTRQRSDGALVRLITPVRSGEDLSAADERLKAFAAKIAPQLPAYIPG